MNESEQDAEAIELLKTANAALRAEVTRLTAEVERLTKVVASVLVADQRTQEELKRCWRLDVAELETVKEELAVTTERLGAAERLVERGKSLARWVLLTTANGQLKLGFEDVAYVQKIADDAAGWLPAGEAKGESP